MEVHLYGPAPPPPWVSKLRIGVQFRYHNSKKLFGAEDIRPVIKDLASTPNATQGANADSPRGAFIVQPWGQWNWPLTLSSPERATLELLDELPGRESFH